MPLVKNGRVVADDYVRVDDAAPLPAGGKILVSAKRFLEAPDALLRAHSVLGVLWPNDRDVEELKPYVDRLTLIALVFPKFRDGRAYSQARRLRETYRFGGELRATGDVLRDQFLFLLRAGFDAFDVRKPTDVAAFDEAIRRYSVFFQPTGDGRVTVPTARRRSGGSQQVGGVPEHVHQGR